MIIRPGPELAFVRFDNSPSFLRRLREKVRFGSAAEGAGATGAAATGRHRGGRPVRRGTAVSLVEVRIQGLAVFDEALVAVGPGFTALTGETGAGKSVCITALRLALGDRVDGDPIRRDRDTAGVSVVFDDVPHALRHRVAEPRDQRRRGDHPLAGDQPRRARFMPRQRRPGVAGGAARGGGDARRGHPPGSQPPPAATQPPARPPRPGRRRHGSPRRPPPRGGEWRAAEATLEEVRRRQAAGAAEVDAARQLVADLGALGMVSGEDEQLATERLRLRNASALAAASTTLRRAAAGDDDAPGRPTSSPPRSTRRWR